MIKKASSINTISLIAERGNSANEWKSMNPDQPNKVDQENSIIVGQKKHHR